MFKKAENRKNHYILLHKNASDELVGTMGNLHFTVGCGGIVNGRGAEQIEGFIPTKHELLQLVKYWATMEWENRWWEFQTGRFGGTEAALILFAADRIKRISSVLGDAAVIEIVDEVKDELGNEVSEQEWQLFIGGNRAEWERVQKAKWNDWNESFRIIKEEFNRCNEPKSTDNR